MHRSIFISVLIWFLLGETIFAAVPTYEAPTREAIKAAAKSCIETGKPENETYTCPIGEYSNGSLQALSNEVIECSLQIALTFAAIDENGKKWVTELQKQRDPDFEKWNADIKDTILAETGSLREQYESVCDVRNFTLPQAGSTEKYGCARSTDFFPETSCKTIAQAKVEGWKNTGYILAARGIAKNSQNDKDVFLDKQKDAYSGILDKWSWYKRIVANAVAKLSAYIRNAVK